MATKTINATFKNATINTQDMTIIEVTKDDTKVYNLTEILDTWTGIDGITFTLKQVDDLKPMDDDREDEN